MSKQKKNYHCYNVPLDQWLKAEQEALRRSVKIGGIVTTHEIIKETLDERFGDGKELS